LVVTLTGANDHDVTQLLPLIDAIPPLQGKRGRPCFRPARAQADRAYHSGPHEAALKMRNIQPVIAHRGTEHGSGLGKTRWVVERTISWLHQFKRLRVRCERRADIHEAFLALGCILICCRIAVRVF
jgi:transposase